MEEDRTHKEESSVWEFVRYILIAIIIVIPFRVFIAQPYSVEGSSMDPTFHDGDYLIVDQISQRFEEPARGTILIVRYPNDTSKFLIKRLIAFPGETVQIKNGLVSIMTNSGEIIELDEPYIYYKKDENFTRVLSQNEYFVMGDNRAGSSDSRIWGPLPRENIVGTPIIRLLPLSTAALMPGRSE